MNYEKLVASLVCDLLQVNDVNPTDNIFELGFHSLLVLQLIVRINDKTGAKLKLIDVFESPSIQRIANSINEQLD